MEPKGFVMHRPHPVSAAGKQYLDDMRLMSKEDPGAAMVAGADPDGDDQLDPDFNPFLAGIPLKLPAELMLSNERRSVGSGRRLLDQPQPPFNLLKTNKAFRTAQEVGYAAGTYAPVLSVAYQRCLSSLPWWQSTV